jgi:hypothetical protein
VACLHTTEALLAKPPDSLVVRLARLNFGQDPSSSSSSSSKKSNTSPAKQQQPELQPAGNSVLAQVLCVLKVHKSGRVSCQTIRRLTALDNAVGLAPGTLLLQLTALAPEPAPPASAVLTAFETDDGPVTMPLAAAEASFGVRLPQLPDKCVDALLTPRAQHSRLALPCPLSPPGEPPAYMRLRKRLRSSEDVRRRRAALQLEQHEVPKGGEPWWQVAARQADPWLGMSPQQGLCEQLAQQLQDTPQQPVMQKGAGIKQQQQQRQAEGGSVAAHAGEAAEQAEVCSAGHELASQPGKLRPADVASWGLRSACLGWDASTEAGGGWLLSSEWGAPGSSCASLPVGSHMPRAAPLVMAEPLDGCRGIRNAALLRGAVAVVSRGRCSFLDKVMVADAVGAVGVVVLNLVSPGELLTMSGDETGRSPDIPALLVGGEDSRTLLWWLQHRPMMAALASLQDNSQQVQQLTHSKDKQQQAQQQQGKGKGKGSSGGGEQQTRVDLLVPGRTQAWLTDNVVKAGINTQSVFEQIVRDERVAAALQQAATTRP